MWTIAKIIVLIYIGFSFYLYRKEARFVFAPRKKIMCWPNDIGLNFEHVVFTTQDGETLAGWFVPTDGLKGSGRILLFCHGNGGNIGDRVRTVETFVKMGLDVMIFDYRGYGNSTGKPSEEGTYMDALAVWNYLKTKMTDPGRIVIYGESLGGAVATWLAGQVRPGALVIESAFTSAVDMARRMFPLLPVGMICRFKYDALSLIKNVKCPVLVAHSRDDEMVPFRYGKRLYERAHEPKRFVEMTGAHNDGGIIINDEYQETLKEFLGEHVG
jgi:fermentation-respiration switch protein FrsA (DUF1100 family)